MPNSKILVATTDEVSGFPAFNEGLLTASRLTNGDQAGSSATSALSCADPVAPTSPPATPAAPD